MTNLMVTLAKDVRLILEPLNGASFVGEKPSIGGHPVLKKDATSLTINVGTLQFGQPLRAVVQMKVPADAASAGYLKATTEYLTRSGDAPLSCECVGKDIVDPDTLATVEPERLRLKAVDTLRRCMQVLKITAADKLSGKELPLDDAQKLNADLMDELKASPCKDLQTMQYLLEDLSGQVTEALSRKEWYERWGIHYLPSLMFAHLTQQCNNFKDAGVQFYGGELFSNLRDAADDIFVTLPPPTPTLRAAPVLVVSPSPAEYAAPTPAYTPAYTPAQPARAVNMAAFYNSGGGCFDGRCLVLMADGTKRPAAEIQKGDTLAGADGGKASEVLCAVRTLSQHGHLPLATLGSNLRITPHHPVFIGGVWQFPVDLAEVGQQPCESVHTFLLKEGGSEVVVEGVPCASLGHGLQEGAACHPYYGSFQAVLADLQLFPGFQSGLVDLKPENIRRDPITGLVCGLDSI
jgi:uncharacterized Zn-binding protein involved in type VI secretion